MRFDSPSEGSYKGHVGLWVGLWVRFPGLARGKPGSYTCYCATLKARLHQSNRWRGRAAPEWDEVTKL